MKGVGAVLLGGVIVMPALAWLLGRTRVLEEWIGRAIGDEIIILILFLLLAAIVFSGRLSMDLRRRNRQSVSDRALLDQATTRHRSLVEQLPEVIYVAALGRGRAWKYVSHQIEGLLDISPEEWLADPGVRVAHIHAADRDRVLIEEAGDCSAGDSWRREYRLRRRDGSIVWILDYGVATTSRNGELEVHGLLSDITLQHQAQEGRLRTEKRFSTAFQHSASGMAIVSADGRWLQANGALCSMLKYSEEELQGLSMQEITHLDDFDDAMAMMSRLASGEIDNAHVTRRYVTKDGTLVWTQVSASIVRDHLAGAPHYFVVQVYDISPRIEAEYARTSLQRQLLQAQKMDAVGRLAGGIAHDFNNLLSVVINFGHFVAETLSDDDWRRSDVEEVIRAGERGAALTRQLLTFSRQDVVSYKVVDLNVVVSGFVDLLARTLGEDVQLRTNLASDLCTVQADAGQLEQVLMNLAVNGRDAMPDGGLLLIETKNCEVNEIDLKTHPRLRKGMFARLSVSDGGCGMSQDVQRQIFEPFFTTKGKTEGTGLGLSTVCGIVERVGGSISVQSEPGRGSTFQVDLPSATGHEPEVEVAAKPVDHRHGAGATVLLVEDEGKVRALVERILTSGGYKVTIAGDGTEALRALKSIPAPVDLLLTDLVMPDMTGVQLAANCPGIPVLFISGHNDDTVAARGMPSQGGNLLQKPFRAHELLAAVEIAIAKPSGHAHILAAGPNARG